MKHKLHKCDDENCFICNGGLAYCEVCHLGEVELVSDECVGGLTQRAPDAGYASAKSDLSTPETDTVKGELPKPAQRR